LLRIRATLNSRIYKSH